MSQQRFWRPSSTPGRSHGGISLQQQLLPIYKHRHQILFALERYDVTVVVGETGSGKSTQIPQYLVLDGGWAGNDFQVVITQPRRVAAQELAKRVAQEVGSPLGQDVGYKVRFDGAMGPLTKVVYCTDGMLLQEATSAKGDPLLSKYSVVMIDEAHERTLNSDALLGLLLRIREKRPQLRLIICSATINAEQFLRFFANPRTKAKGTIISVDGRQFPVETFYLEKPTPNYLEEMVDTAWKIHSEDKEEAGSGGDILCFLPTGEDIDQAIRLAEETFERRSPPASNNTSQVAFLPLYGNLPYHVQARIFETGVVDSRRKKHVVISRRVIFATNIAETSVTVPGIRYVIDSGLVKLPYFDPLTGLERLLVGPISQASAAQRAGRAGRIQEGRTYRLYTEQYFNDVMDLHTPPEILRTNLSSFILTLKALGVDNILAFDLLDVPTVETLKHAMESLYVLGAIDEDTRITEYGIDMAAFPVEPRVAKMLLESVAVGCSWEILAVASALQVRDLFQKPRANSRSQQEQLDFQAALSQFMDPSGDHVTYANIFADADDKGLSERYCKEMFINYLAMKQGMEVRAQLARFLKRFGKIQSLGIVESHGKLRSQAICRCVTSAFFANVAKLASDGHYYTLRKRVLVSPETGNNVVGKEYIVYGETIDAGTRGGIQLRHVSSIEARWLRELAPHYWE